eukprot:GHVQ01001297.1.p2 GENE.GHVQ01001297.1~~GHVQ01001297.1.p2  ORF type:complete len:114 (-),score=9.22 GHVQ01001297.1:324-665(-)
MYVVYILVPLRTRHLLVPLRVVGFASAVSYQLFDRNQDILCFVCIYLNCMDVRPILQRGETQNKRCNTPTPPHVVVVSTRRHRNTDAQRKIATHRKKEESIPVCINIGIHGCG